MSTSSVAVAAFQPPMASMQALRQTQELPLREAMLPSSYRPTVTNCWCPISMAWKCVRKDAFRFS